MDTINNNTTAVEIAQILLLKGIKKVIIANINNKIVISHSEADFLIPLLINSNEWREHEAVMLNVDEKTQCVYVLCIHSTMRGIPIGGVRLLQRPQFLAGLNDCLALSYGMTQKNAFSEIWAGGAKSVIIPFTEQVFEDINNKRIEKMSECMEEPRKSLWVNYGAFLSTTQGLYLVGEDSRLNSIDMQYILGSYLHSCCLPQEVGGAGNVSPRTAKGIYKAILATCEVGLPKSSGISNKKIIIKGAGLVGASLAEQLLEAGADILIYDTDPKSIEKLDKLNGKIEFKIIARTDDENEEDFKERFKREELELLASIEADIFSPNALSGTLTKELIEVLKVKAIVGAENAQIAKKDRLEIIDRLHSLGIIYVPEPAINYMGVFSAYQEHRGILYSEFDRKSEQIYHETKKILIEAKAQNRTPYDIFIAMSVERATKPHPIDGHRGIEIINELVESWSSKNIRK